MPRWNVADLPPAPVFTRKQWTLLLGPGLLMGGAAIGGGEWLTGPIVTARYGGAMLWLATLSVLGQVIYNIEISRYTLYSGEPIFTGKFRTIPGPKFWIIAYLLLDFGSFFPYLAASAAVPLFTAINGELPFVSADPTVADDESTLHWIGIAIFVFSMVPLIFGGKIYNSLKHIMSFKIVAVLGFLTVVAIFYSTVDTWKEIGSGFLKFGSVPIKRVEDLNGNGVLDDGEDWDSDNRLDVIEPPLSLVIDDTAVGQTPEEFQIKAADGTVSSYRVSALPLTTTVDTDGDGLAEGPFRITKADLERKYLDLDGDGTQDGDNIDNIFMAAASGRGLPPIDWSLVAFLSALVAISGSGGLSNTPISNYTRDQGWGMGKHVGAIPGMLGGHDLALSHTGTVFHPDEESMPRWKRWYRHIVRDQLVVWMPACFLGLALPSMLSVQFLARGTTTDNKWEASVMTAGALRDAVGGGSLRTTFW
ncbi:MAG: Nramp family divalent metal transporter, partial [Planctomycetaceae bacterium]